MNIYRQKGQREGILLKYCEIASSLRLLPYLIRLLRAGSFALLIAGT
jgi:hypothetical protein